MLQDEFNRLFKGVFVDVRTRDQEKNLSDRQFEANTWTSKIGDKSNVRNPFDHSVKQPTNANSSSKNDNIPFKPSNISALISNNLAEAPSLTYKPADSTIKTQTSSHSTARSLSTPKMPSKTSSSHTVKYDNGPRGPWGRVTEMSPLISNLLPNSRQNAKSVLQKTVQSGANNGSVASNPTLELVKTSGTPTISKTETVGLYRFDSINNNADWIYNDDNVLIPYDDLDQILIRKNNIVV